MGDHHRQHDAPYHQEQEVEEPSATLYRAIGRGVDGPLDWSAVGVGSVHVDKLTLLTDVGHVHGDVPAQLMDFEPIFVVSSDGGGAQRADEPNGTRCVADHGCSGCINGLHVFVR